MTVILRSAELVPTLFSMGVDAEDRMVPGGERMGPRLTRLATRLRRTKRRDIDRALCRYIPALLLSSTMLLFVGKPILRAASLAVGVAPIY